MNECIAKLHMCIGHCQDLHHIVGICREGWILLPAMCGAGGWNNICGGADIVMLGTVNSLAILGFLDEGYVAEEDAAGISDGELVLILFCLTGKPNGAGIHPIAALNLESVITTQLVPIFYDIILSLLEPLIAIIEHLESGG